MTEPQEHELLRVDEVAELLRVSIATLEKMRRTGKGPPWIKLSGTVGRPGGQIRYRRLDIEAYLATRTVQPKPVDRTCEEDQPLPGFENIA
jgi:predicted DNA-binding transcriptional regulator AlpA